MGVGRSSGRRAERFFCEAIVCGKMTAFWEDSGRLSYNSEMKSTCLTGVAGVAFPGVTAAANMGDRYWFLVIVFMDLLHVVSVLTAVT